MTNCWPQLLTVDKFVRPAFRHKYMGAIDLSWGASYVTSLIAMGYAKVLQLSNDRILLLKANETRQNFNFAAEAYVIQVSNSLSKL